MFLYLLQQGNSSASDFGEPAKPCIVSVWQPNFIFTPVFFYQMIPIKHFPLEITCSFDVSYFFYFFNHCVFIHLFRK